MGLSTSKIAAFLKPKRRWFQFSLATLFLVTTALAVWLGIWTDRARKQQRAVEAIRQRGGIVAYSYETEGGPGQPTPPGPRWLRDSLGIDYLDRVVAVNFTGDTFTDADLELLQGSPRLENLFLHSANITDAGLVHLQGLRELRVLRLECSITDAGMEHLTGLTRLRILRSVGSPDDKVKTSILEGLDMPVVVDFPNAPLVDVCDYLHDLLRIKPQIDDAALKEANLDRLVKVTYKTPRNDLPLRSVLDSMLEPVGLDWYVGEGALVITTRDVVARKHAGIERLQQALPNLKEVKIDW